MQYVPDSSKYSSPWTKTPKFCCSFQDILSSKIKKQTGPKVFMVEVKIGSIHNLTSPLTFESFFSISVSFIPVFYQSCWAGREWKQFVTWPFPRWHWVVCSFREREKKKRMQVTKIYWTPWKEIQWAFLPKRQFAPLHEWSLSLAACCNWPTPTRPAVVCISSHSLCLS